MSQDTVESTERSRYTSIAADEHLTACQAMAAIFKEYARERPEVVALWAFGIGFVLGWKLKLW
jgi:exonuclease V gamma subunit